MTGYTNPDSLVETDWIEQQGDSQDIAILEVDEDTTAYEKGHIPNAISIDWANDLHDVPRREFVSSEQLAKLLGEKGVSSDQRSCCTAETTTGSRPTRIGCSSIAASRT